MYTRAIRNNVLDQYAMVKGLCSSKSNFPSLNLNVSNTIPIPQDSCASSSPTTTTSQ